MVFQIYMSQCPQLGNLGQAHARSNKLDATVTHKTWKAT